MFSFIYLIFGSECLHELLGINWWLWTDHVVGICEDGGDFRICRKMQVVCRGKTSKFPGQMMASLNTSIASSCHMITARQPMRKKKWQHASGRGRQISAPYPTTPVLFHEVGKVPYYYFKPHIYLSTCYIALIVKFIPFRFYSHRLRGGW